MKIIVRTLIILGAALVVVAGLTAFAQSSAGQALRSAEVGGHGPRHAGGGHEGDFAGSPSAEGTNGIPFFGDERPAGFAGRGEHGDSGPSLFGLVEVAKNLAIVAVSVILIVVGGRMLRLGRGAPSES